MAQSAATEFFARARRRRRWRCAIEASAAGIAAAGVAVASAIGQQPGRAPEVRHLATLGVLCAAAMAATWWFERAKLADRELALRVDRRLGRDGAWFSLWEARRAGLRTAWIEALEAREAAALTPDALSKAMPMPSATWLALPCLAAALLAVAWERPGFLAPAGSPGAGLAAGRESGPADPAGAELRGGAAARDAEEASRQIPPPDEAGASRTGPEGVRIEVAAGSQPESVAGNAATVPTAAEEGNSTLANRGAERTMVGSQRSDAAASSAGAAAEPHRGAADGTGTLTGRWWPERHDALVQGWRRALAARGGRE